jgi:hypothetical protein
LDWKIGCHDTELVVDKHLKLDEPFLSNLQSTQPCPIEDMDPVSISSRADEKALENAKTGKVNTVVAVMHIFSENKVNHLTLLPKIVLKRPN